jgi:hypothetical protein
MSAAPFPIPAHQTGRADCPHPAPTGFIAELTNEAPVGPAKLQDSQLTEYRVFGEAVGATRMHLMTPSQEMPYVSHRRGYEPLGTPLRGFHS